MRGNNRVRRAIDAAIGALSQSNPDPRIPLAAAERVFRSRGPEAIPALDAQLTRETDARIRRAMETARAAAVFASQRPNAEKLEVIAVVARRGDLESLGLLAGLTGASPAVAEAAVAAIDRRQAIIRIVQAVDYGVSLASVLLLAAIGLAVTFGTMGVINRAHGEMVMLGAYTTFVVEEVTRQNAPHLFDWSLAFAILLAFLVSALAGAIVERTIICLHYGRPLETLLATFGLSLILQQAVRTIFGPNKREVGNPSWLSGALRVADVLITRKRLWIIVFAALMLFGLMLVLRRTAFGLAVRAVTQNRRKAVSMGIGAPWIARATFALGSGVAGLAGVALRQIDNVSPTFGQSYIIDSLMVVFARVGNLWGTLVAALSLGIVNNLLEPVAGAVLGEIVVLVLLVLFILRAPRGLLPLKGRAVES